MPKRADCVCSGVDGSECPICECEPSVWADYLVTVCSADGGEADGMLRPVTEPADGALTD